MKYLVLIVVVLAVIWIVRAGGRRTPPGPGAQARNPGSPGVPQEMVECVVCHVHLPRSDALAGPGGQVFCCAEHRKRAGA